MKNNLTILKLFNNLHLTDNINYLTTTLKGISGIYCIRCTVTGAMYIGSAVDLAKRAAEHLFYSKTNEHLQRAIAKYGLEHFDFIVVEFCELDSLLKREQYYLDWLFSQPVELRYNILPAAGSRIGSTHSDETKVKISNTLTGRTLTEETRIKISESHKGTHHPMYGKVAFNSIKITVFSLDNTLVKEFTSQKAAAEWLGVSNRTLRRYLNKKVFDNKYIIKND